MRKISEKQIITIVASLCVKANMHLRPDIVTAFKKARISESSDRAKKILSELLENARVARRENIALCQDTGLPVVFVDVGRDVDVSGVDLNRAIREGVKLGYARGYLRNSIVPDPLKRLNPTQSTPPVIHFDFGRHKGLKITVLPKGFGSENKTKLGMLSPTQSNAEIKDFIVNAVKEAGPDACPPYVLGIGIGGSADYAALLAKKALLRPVHRRNSKKYVAQMEKELFKEINDLSIGPMGLGGKSTVLGVNILTYPTHMAGLPVCVNVSCHALRSASDCL
ncbi:MAG: fumarate hydratase [Candidatus Omnitrophota bacterium]